MPAPNLSKLAPYAAAGVISVTLAVTGVFAIFDNALYDIFSKLSTTPDPYGKIVLVTVDAKTVERYGNESFWTRTRYRELLDELESAGAKAVYFDYFFSEKTKPENVDWDVLRESAGMSEKSLDEAYLRYDKTTKSKDFTSEIDYDFARAIKTYGNVLFPRLIRKNSASGTVIAEPLPIFSAYARVWLANAYPDSDGVLRQSVFWTGKTSSVAKLVAEAVSAPGPLPKIPADAGTYRPRFVSAPYAKTFPTIPFEYAYNGKMETRSRVPVPLSGAVVIVGDYAEASGDLHPVPTGGKARMSGMEIVAHEARSLAEGDFLADVPRGTVVTAALFSFFALSAFFLVFWSPVLSVLLFVSAASALFFGSYWLFSQNLWFPPAVPISSTIAAFLAWGYSAYRRANADKDGIRKIFSRYVDASVVETLVKQDGIPSVKGELREVSVLFADIEGFTTVSEKLDPESTVACLNRLFSKVNSVIFSERGTINKYIGDAVMAFWGAPQTNEKHAASSCSAALGMLVATEADAKEGLRLRIGIATGEALVGNVGDERFSDYTVMGDRVNFASRLEGLTRKYGVSVLVSERTAKIVGKDFLLREIDSVKVKGKVRAEKIYELMKRDGDASIDDRRLARRHERALSSYRSGDFDAARKEFAKNAAFGDLPAKVFMDRMDGWNGSPPKGFDGSYSFDSK